MIMYYMDISVKLQRFQSWQENYFFHCIWLILSKNCFTTWTLPPLTFHLCWSPNIRKPRQLIMLPTSTKFVHRCVSWPILKRVKKIKSFVISSILLKCFKNQNKLRICANFVFVNQSQQNSKNCWCFNNAN